MTLCRVNLEDFEDELEPLGEENIEYLRGFEAGQAEAQTQGVAALTQATEAISTTLSDMAFGYTEARVHLIEKIRPLLAQVAEVLLPQIAQDSFTAHFVDVVIADFDRAAGQPVQIAVSPSAVEHLKANLPEGLGSFVFIPDDSLVEGQALIETTEANVLIDIPAITLALQTALNGLDSLERTHAHGK